jgi:hypothetical protein
MRIVVYGTPAPQGSKRFVGIRGGKGIMLESSKAVKPWREAVKYAAIAVRSLDITSPPFDGPLVVRMIFTVAKPKSLRSDGRIRAGSRTSRS